MLYSHDTNKPPVLNTIQEANDYRRELTAQITTAAVNGDTDAFTSLLPRLNALPLLIAGMVVRQAQANVSAWEQALQEASVRYAEARRLNASLAPVASNYHAEQDAQAQEGAARLHIQKLQDGQGSAHNLVRRAQTMLTRTVSDSSAGLAEADSLLRELNAQADTLRIVTNPPRHSRAALAQEQAAA